MDTAFCFPNSYLQMSSELADTLKQHFVINMILPRGIKRRSYTWNYIYYFGNSEYFSHGNYQWKKILTEMFLVPVRQS